MTTKRYTPTEEHANNHFDFTLHGESFKRVLDRFG